MHCSSSIEHVPFGSGVVVGGPVVHPLITFAGIGAGSNPAVMLKTALATTLLPPPATTTT